MRKRGLPSPDHADGYCYSSVRTAATTEIDVESHSGSSITGDLLDKAW
jgi:hypothetical protein